MKKLTGIRLINWHGFLDEHIKIKNSTLITGENGAGKSTILDAIQYVLTCSSKNFNKAANDTSKRNLEGYVRYKTGKEDKKFERNGNITSNVALEFFSEDENKYFIIGVVIDSASETSVKSIFYRMEKIRIDDIEFITKDEEPRNIENFKTYCREFKIKVLNSTEAKRDFRNRLGNLSPKFLELLPKALAFKPIKNVKEFVFSYVLEEKEVRIEDLKNNIRAYREFQSLLEVVKEKINKLEEIKRIKDEIEKLQIRGKIQEYVYKKAEYEEYLEKIRNIEKKINIKRAQISNYENRKEVIDEEKRNRQNEKNTIQIEISTNSEFRAVENYKRELEKDREIYNELAKGKDRLKEQIERQKKYIKELVLEDKREEYNTFLKELNLLDRENYKGFNVIAEEFKNSIKDDRDESISLKITYDKKGKELSDREREKEKIIKELENKNLNYDKNILDLKEVIERESKRRGRVIEPKILCELLEIKDEAWASAIEGYLNTQRFYLLVHEDDFDISIQIYNSFKEKNKIYNVGIINTKKLKNFDSYMENSLASIIESKSSDAKRYINSILGNVIMCEKLDRLKEHKISLTKDGMLYKNNVVRAIDPKISKKPFIGREAYLKQLKIEKEELNLLKEKLEEVKKERINIDRKIKMLDKIDLSKITENNDVLEKEYIQKERIKDIEKKIEEFKKNQSYLELSLKINDIDEELKEKFKEIRRIEEVLKEENKNLGGDEKELSNLKERGFLTLEALEEYKKIIGDLYKEADEKFIKEKKNKPLKAIKENFSRSNMGTKNKIESVKEELCKEERNYNLNYEFGGEIGLSGANKFILELDRLKRSKLIDYEEKVKISKERAEEEFKEHFISKIKENIEMAKSEVKGLNKGLKGILFGKEGYEFKTSKNKELKEFYDMFMDDENIGSGETLFSMSYNAKYKDLLKELFEKLTLDDENSEKIIRKYTDYRNYMDYDICITYEDGRHALFSKVNAEKSGGETQTPYYVIMASSFMQIYKSKFTKTESIGIMLFDEAFDKMDNKRIMATMEFYKNLDIQMIMATPPGKIDIIAPYVNTTLLTFNTSFGSIIEEIKNENI